MKQVNELTYSERYYRQKKADALGITLEEYLKRESFMRGGTSEPVEVPVIDFAKVQPLDIIHIPENMLAVYKTGLPMDTLTSYEGGIPVATNIMVTGDPGVGKTTVMLHTLANLKLRNPELKVLFICAEMSKVQMFKYMKRFPIFGIVETIFPVDFMNYNTKDYVEQLIQKGYDYVLIDSIVEVLESVKEESGMSAGAAEKWLVDLASKHNEGLNDAGKFTTFLFIQQVTKAGVFVGSNKLKHITDAHLEMKKIPEKDGGGTYMWFTKNRNGSAFVKYTYTLTTNDVKYATYVGGEGENNTPAGGYQLVQGDEPAGGQENG